MLIRHMGKLHRLKREILKNWQSYSQKDYRHGKGSGVHYRKAVNGRDAFWINFESKGFSSIKFKGYVNFIKKFVKKEFDKRIS